jgi:5,10-methylenetetrahydromethanopterin reductase
VSVYHDLLFQPTWPALIEVARHTRRVRIGPAAVNPFTAHPVEIAGQAALLDEVSGGRAYLGLARGAWLDGLGLEPRRPVRALREALECIRRLLEGSGEPYAGEVFRLPRGAVFRWPVPRPDLPFLLGAWGGQTVRACAGLVEEVKVGGTVNPAVVPRVRADLRAGAPGRRVGLAVGAVCVVDRDGEAARALARRKAALYLPIIARLDPTLPVEPARLAALGAAVGAGDLAGAARLIPDDVLRLVGFAGTPDDVAQQALALFAAGADRVEFGTPHGLTPETGLRLLGEVVLPVLRRAPAGAT